jgi:Ca2+-transporting ATPase
MRVIALARRGGGPIAGPPAGPQDAVDPETGLHFLGFVGLFDPPREEVAPAVAKARQAGIKTLMITGDHPATGQAVAVEIGLWQDGDELLTGYELDRMDQQQLIGRIDAVRVVARATAEHKLRIVEALKARGLICAMTGDGVNDAPAVKAASIGIAMGRAGTDVTKEAASLVLSDDNYATIVAAVEEGRAIYANIRKSVFFLLSSNAGCVLVVFLASVFGWRTPLMPVQILWINLITNGLPALALGLDGREPEQMRVPPRQPGGSMLLLREYLHILLIGALMAACALLAYDVALGGPERLASREALLRAQTICYAILALGPLCHAFNCRSAARSIFAGGLADLFSNRALWGAVLCGVVLWGVTIYVPPLRPVFSTAALDRNALLWVAAMSLLPVAAVEGVKRMNARSR